MEFQFEAPSYHLLLEGLLFIWVLWLLRRKKKHLGDKNALTLEEEEQVIRAWKPKPLVSPVGDELVEDEEDDGEDAQIWGPIEGRPGKYVEIEGKKYLNLATHNYLGLVDNPELDTVAEECIRKYGVGSCGPRGFYGTVDVHLKLEEKIASFLNLEETALYSYGFSTIASAIPSYAKAGDIIFADEQVNFSIQKGLQASRSVIRYFKHNDFRDLQRLLQEQYETDRKNFKKAKTIRRFCVVEGIYSKTGEMCPLNEIAVLCRKNKVRLFVDESLSFGVIGKTGRGVTEFLGVPIEDLDLISGSLEHALAAFGGFIVGPSFVVDHQRISGLGYCFSASLPPLLAGVGIRSLKMIEDNPEIVAELQRKCQYVHQELKKLTFFRLSGHELSPIKHIYLQGYDTEQKLPRKIANSMLNDIIKRVKDVNKVALVKPGYLVKQEKLVPDPSIRITVNRLLTKEEIDFALHAIEAASVLTFQSRYYNSQ